MTPKTNRYLFLLFLVVLLCAVCVESKPAKPPGKPTKPTTTTATTTKPTTTTVKPTTTTTTTKPTTKPTTATTTTTTTTKVSDPTTEVTVNGQVFQVLIPTDLGETVVLQEVTFPADGVQLGGIAVLGATIDIDEAGNSNVESEIISNSQQSGKNGAPSRSVSLSHAVAVGVCLIWAALNLAGLA